MINAAPNAASGGEMVYVCRECDPDPLGIKSAQLAAVAAERERCAKIAENYFRTLEESDRPVYRMMTAGSCIAVAIRKST